MTLAAFARYNGSYLGGEGSREAVSWLHFEEEEDGFVLVLWAAIFIFPLYQLTSPKPLILLLLLCFGFSRGSKEMVELTAARRQYCREL